MAVDMFIKIGDIKGESKDSAHKYELDIDQWSWGMSQMGSMHVGGGGGAGKVNVQDLNFTHYIDKSSPNLMLACCNGKHYGEAVLTVRKAGENPLEYVKITMQNVLVTGVSTGGATGSDRLSENVTLNFEKVKVMYQPQKPDGTKDGGPIEIGWDIGAGVKL